MSPNVQQVGDLLPPPTAFGLPDKFDEWRPGQEEYVLNILDDPCRFQVMVAATGAGKSCSYVTAAILKGGRALILTSTKALQTQLKTDFGMRIADVRGRNAYPCANDESGEDSCEEGLCMSGWRCPLQTTPNCAYYAALIHARQSKIVSTNYSFWMSVNSAGSDNPVLGQFDLLICDEAHDLPNAVTGFLSVRMDLEGPYVAHKAPPVYRRLAMTADEWSIWGAEMYGLVTKQLATSKAYLREGNGSRQARRELVALTRLERYFSLLKEVKGDDNWVCYPTEDLGGLSFGPVWASPFVERVLFHKIPKVVMTSASVNSKTVQLIGVKDAKVFEFPHTFPVENRLVTYVPTVRMNFRTDDSQLRLWVTRIDQIIRGRLDRKGVIHTVSYRRRDFLMRNSEFAKLMMTHNSRDTERMVREFKGAEPPKILVSPSVTTGFDFPGALCEYQIIGKLPYPDTTDWVTKARIKADQEYAAYIAMQELVQAAGRGVRSVEDRCETMVIDDSIVWFKKRFWKFAPRWFQQAYRVSQTIPAPPPKLGWGKEVEEQEAAGE